MRCGLDRNGSYVTAMAGRRILMAGVCQEINLRYLSISIGGTDQLSVLTLWTGSDDPFSLNVTRLAAAFCDHPGRRPDLELAGKPFRGMDAYHPSKSPYCEAAKQINRGS